ncbi:cyclin-dependent kinase inhibitor 7-like isoform X1 [Momordica charantia]|uniref:Cyclin-dependent kinase inhibitor 7-like isoform X1 n=1 Tax=Momordica charantia TaxID=3673 RepID=A0A6J1D801_MOMCH|nr:cyclin-dependent kinase inhibitor 7-like isoform X1 [Momordica charantia]
MVKKCRGVAEISVMELDLRTTRAAQPDLDDDDLPASTSNKRKITAGTDLFQFSTATTSFLKLRSRRRRRILLPENSVATAPPETTVLRQPRTSSTTPCSDDDASAICCSSSNGCSEVVEESRVIKFVDLEDENNDELGVRAYENRSRESLRIQSHKASVLRSSFPSSCRRETTPSSKFRSAQSDDMESPAGKSEATSGDTSSLSVAKMPTESDLEEFFISAEKNLQKCFAEKYNYDIVEDVPLEGRYEWIRLKP